MIDQTIAFPLSPQSSVRFDFSGPITQEDIEIIRQVLELSKRAFPMDAPAPATPEASS